MSGIAFLASRKKANDEPKHTPSKDVGIRATLTFDDSVWVLRVVVRNMDPVCCMLCMLCMLCVCVVCMLHMLHETVLMRFMSMYVYVYVPCVY